MPNWTDNVIVITGSGENLDKLLKKVITDDSNPNEIQYNLTNCFPKPEIFKTIHQGARTFDGVTVDAWFEDDEGARPMLDIVKEDIIKEHGTYKPVDWEYTNWGTKWGDCDTKLISEKIVEHDQYADGQLVFTFDSAWGEPFRLLNDIARKYDVKISNSLMYEFEEQRETSNYPWSDEETKAMYDKFEQDRDAMLKMVKDMFKEKENN
tara:strand:- start:9221 stop:9844 length:624 start_codon:yes stop_codon:yes gene_type:complete